MCVIATLRRVCSFIFQISIWNFDLIFFGLPTGGAGRRKRLRGGRRGNGKNKTRGRGSNQKKPTRNGKGKQIKNGESKQIKETKETNGKNKQNYSHGDDDDDDDVLFVTMDKTKVEKWWY